MKIISKLRRALTRQFIRPIRVFVFHQVSDVYDSLKMWECDWTQTDDFKAKINALLGNGYRFISLNQAYLHLQNDVIRIRKYAVLTSDDGYHSLINILPWLKEQKIPITLFINPKYLDNKSWSPINEEQAKRINTYANMNEVVKGLFLSNDQLFSFDYELIEIGMHGYEHLDNTTFSKKEFSENVRKCFNILSIHPRFIPFYAYTWGKHNEETDSILRTFNIIPVLCDGSVNHNNTKVISRESFDGPSKIMSTTTKGI